MNISKEAIEAAERAFVDSLCPAMTVGNRCRQEALSAALTAALPHLAPKATPSDEEWAANLEKYGRYSTKQDSEEMKAVYLRAFAAVRAEEREACAKLADEEEKGFLSPEYATGQPLGSFSERFACSQIADAIRGRKS